MTSQEVKMSKGGVCYPLSPPNMGEGSPPLPKKIKVSAKELEAIFLPERYPATEVTEFMRLPGKSNVLDHIDLSLTPYLVEPITFIGDSSVLWIILIGPTQSGKTVFLQTAVADTIDQSPVNSLYVMPDGKNGARAMEEKVISLILATPKLKRHTLTPYKNTLTQKAIKLDNMVLYGASSGSLGDLSSIPYGRVFLDEVRLFKLSIKKESNAVKLATDRLTTFRKFGIAQGYMVSTPSEEGDLLHQQTKVPGTLELFFYSRCGSCNRYQILDFFLNVKFNKKSLVAECKCKYCDAIFSEDKPSWTVFGKYGTIGQDGEIKLKDYKKRERMVFRFSSLESPFRSFQMIWDEFIQTKDQVTDYKNFIQAWLAQFWKNTLSTITAEELRASSEDSSLFRGEVPAWTKTVTAGIDTQDDGFYVVVRAWGEKRRTHILDAFFIECKMAISTDQEVLDALSQVEEAVYYSESKKEWGISLYPIDTGGHRTLEIYEAASNLQKIVLIKGKNTQAETIQYSSGVQDLYLVRTSDYLDETEQSMTKVFWTTASGLPDDFYNQYVNSKKVTEKNQKTGRSKVVWAKAGQNDYRMADIHSYIAIDIPLSSGTMRRKLTKVGWEFNPIYKAKLVDESSLGESLLDSEFSDSGWENDEW